MKIEPIFGVSRKCQPNFGMETRASAMDAYNIVNAHLYYHHFNTHFI